MSDQKQQNKKSQIVDSENVPSESSINAEFKDSDTSKEEKQKQMRLEQNQKSTVDHSREDLKEPKEDTKVEKSALLGEVEESALPEEAKMRMLLEETEKSALPEEAGKSALPEDAKQSTLLEKAEMSAFPEKVTQSTFLEEVKQSALVEKTEKSALVEEAEMSAFPEERRQSAFLEEAEMSTLPEESGKSALSQEVKQSVFMEKAKESVLSEEAEMGTLPEESGKSVLSQEVKQSAFMEKAKESVLSEEAEMGTLPEESGKSALSQEVKQSAFMEKAKESVLSEEAEMGTLPEESGKSALSQEVKQSVFMEKAKESVLSESGKSALSQEVKQSVFMEKAKESVLSEEAEMGTLPEESGKSVLSQEVKQSAFMEKAKESVLSEEAEMEEAELSVLPEKTMLPEGAEHTVVENLWTRVSTPVIILIAVGVALCANQFCGTQTSDSRSALQIFQDEFKQLQKDFPEQNRNVWLRSGKMLTNHLNKSHPDEPAMIMLTAAQDAKHTLLCLGSGLAQTYAVALNSSWLLIRGPSEAQYDSSTAKLHIDETLSSGFETKHRAAVLNRLETLPPGSLLILYKYCDHENAAYKNVALIFTVLLEDSSLEPDTPLPELEEKVRDFLWQTFIRSGTIRSHQEMDSDKLGGVWSRISHLVLPVLPVKSIEAGNCPFDHE